MKVLLLGVGMQGKAALHDLARSQAVTEIIAADRDFDALQAHVVHAGYGLKVQPEHVDAADLPSIDRLMALGPDVVIDLLPVAFHGRVAAAAVGHGVHVVNASYATPELKKLDGQARAKGLALLPEFGMDPGIDLVLLGEAVRACGRIEDIITYGAGFPEPDAAHNPLKYKVTWTFDGVLISYRRAGRVIRQGHIVDIPATEMFAAEHTHEIELEGLGRLEAFPNGDALAYADALGIETAGLRNMGRYVLRWPGHCAFWKALVDLHLLDDEPALVDGVAVNRRRYLAAVLEPHLQYGLLERDVVVVRVDVTGRQDGHKTRALLQVIDRRDLGTGFTAMSRTVGFTTSIGAQMIGDGRISRRGLLSPLNDVPFEAFVAELKKRNIVVQADFSPVDEAKEGII
ncbi:MAG: saccharopine dehydrogenase family protein [Chloroflexota bacterium]